MFKQSLAVLSFHPCRGHAHLVSVKGKTLYGETQAYSQWKATFADFLTEQTGLNYTFTLVHLNNEIAIGRATMDLIYSAQGCMFAWRYHPLHLPSFYIDT